MGRAAEGGVLEMTTVDTADQLTATSGLIAVKWKNMFLLGALLWVADCWKAAPAADLQLTSSGWLVHSVRALSWRHPSSTHGSRGAGDMSVLQCQDALADTEEVGHASLALIPFPLELAMPRFVVGHVTRKYEDNPCSKAGNYVPS